MSIFHFDPKPGERTHGILNVGELAFMSPIPFPVMVLRGKEDGPVLWICGNIHGEELNGPLALIELYRELDLSSLSGTLVFTPLLNAMAFLNRSKTGPIDKVDMDTVFPGNSEGLQAERTALILFNEIRRTADAVINLHTLNTRFRAIPYTNYKIVSGANPLILQKSSQMALAFGAAAICRIDLATASGELPGVTQGALDIACIAEGIPAIMGEMGGGGRIEDENISVTKRGIINVMKYLGMEKGEPEKPLKQIVVTNRRFLRSNRGGYVRVLAEPGTVHSSGTPYARIFNWWEELDTPSLEQDIYIIGSRLNPLVSTGDRLALVGMEWEEA